MSQEHIRKFDVLVAANDNEQLPAANDNREDKSTKTNEGELIKSAVKEWDLVKDAPENPEKTA